MYLFLDFVISLFVLVIYVCSARYLFIVLFLCGLCMYTYWSLFLYLFRYFGISFFSSFVLSLFRVCFLSSDSSFPVFISLWLSVFHYVFSPFVISSLLSSGMSLLFYFVRYFFICLFMSFVSSWFISSFIYGFRYLAMCLFLSVFICLSYFVYFILCGYFVSSWFRYGLCIIFDMYSIRSCVCCLLLLRHYIYFGIVYFFVPSFFMYVFRYVCLSLFRDLFLRVRYVFRSWFVYCNISTCRSLCIYRLLSFSRCYVFISLFISLFL